MMLESLAEDAAKDASLEVTVLVDAARPIRLPPSATLLEVRAGEEIASLVEASRGADWSVIVAPETAGVLPSRVERVRAGGGTVLGCGAGFLAVAADKQATIDALAAAGVPVPAGRSLAAGEGWPAGFRLPAVRKPRASAGCDDVAVVRTAGIGPASRAARLEAFAEGVAVGVSVLCGAASLVPLPPMRQQFSGGLFPRYVGGEPLEAALADRAIDLARRAIRAVEHAAGRRDAASASPAGWVGVDMILGDRGDGSADRVLEVNPRLTTSFVGLAAGFGTSLVGAMIDVVRGRPIALPDEADRTASAFTLHEPVMSHA